MKEFNDGDVTVSSGRLLRMLMTLCEKEFRRSLVFALGLSFFGVPSGVVFIVSEKGIEINVVNFVNYFVDLEHIRSIAPVSQGGKIKSFQSFWVR